MTIVTEELNQEITKIIKTDKKLTREEILPTAPLTLKASVFPNPSNLGKVRLSLEHLPEEPLFIQIFNQDDELIQEGVIRGTLGSSLNHTLSLPNASGTYKITLSDTQKILKDMELEIL
ncbi:MAG: hypothetical protein AAF960_16040 [Bacteroidota bacterium]